MTTIPIPIGRGMRFCGPGFILCVSAVVFSCQIAWPWRLAAASSVLTLGAMLWIHYLRHRPVSLTVRPDGGLDCKLADGRRLAVVRLLPGIVHPCLLSGRLADRSGESCNLFVPGWQITHQAHWQLRRALIGFRPVQSDERRGM